MAAEVHLVNHSIDVHYEATVLGTVMRVLKALMALLCPWTSMIQKINPLKVGDSFRPINNGASYKMLRMLKTELLLTQSGTYLGNGHGWRYNLKF